MTRIAHLSDLHLLEPGFAERKGLSRYRLAYLSALAPLDPDLRRERAARTLARARALAVDHVVITGDLTEDGCLEQFEVAADVLAHSGFAPEQITLVPGNHDAYSEPDAWRTALDGPLRPYRESSPEAGAWMLPDAVIFPISTLIPRQPFTRAQGFIQQDDLDAVDRLLRDSAAQRRTLIVAQHHAPLRRRNPFWNWTEGVISDQHVRGFLAERAQIHVIHGHTHEHSTLAVGGRDAPQLFSAPSCRDDESALRVYHAVDRQLIPEERLYPPAGGGEARSYSGGATSTVLA